MDALLILADHKTSYLWFINTLLLVYYIRKTDNLRERIIEITESFSSIESSILKVRISEQEIELNKQRIKILELEKEKL